MLLPHHLLAPFPRNSSPIYRTCSAKMQFSLIAVITAILAVANACGNGPACGECAECLNGHCVANDMACPVDSPRVRHFTSHPLMKRQLGTQIVCTLHRFQVIAGWVWMEPTLAISVERIQQVHNSSVTSLNLKIPSRHDDVV